jgi:nitrite reductase/ring-hydroxylating ferredoxin subunit
VSRRPEPVWEAVGSLGDFEPDRPERCEVGECWLHGSTFNLESGKPSCLPAVDPVPVYPTKIEGDVVYVATNVEL